MLSYYYGTKMIRDPKLGYILGTVCLFSILQIAKLLHKIAATEKFFDFVRSNFKDKRYLIKQ